MLVLGRKVGESVILTIGGETVANITISSIHAGTVRIGFEAPEYLTIVRTEVARDVQTEVKDGV